MYTEKWIPKEYGVINRDAGNSVENFTGSYRRGEKPFFKETGCIHCFFCWAYCPENAIRFEEEKITGIDYDYCKGCGICVNECPVKHEPIPIILIKETNELEINSRI